MQNSKLIDLLKTFDKEDWRWFRKFLLSPYFNSREELIPFFDYLRKQAPELNEKAIRKERVFKKVFPNQKYNEKQISYSMNFILAQAERFLAQREIEKHPPLINHSLLKSFINRNLDKNYNYQYIKSIKDLEDYKTKSIDYYLFEFQLADLASSRHDSQKLREYGNHLQIISSKLDQLYLIYKIKFYCEIASNSKILETAYVPTFEKEVITLAESSKFKEIPIVNAYLKAYNMMKKENTEESFVEFKNLLKKYNKKLPLNEIRELQYYAINYCINQINRNNNRKFHIEKLLELYLKGIEDRILLEKGHLSPWTFKNVVKLGLNLKKYDFTEDFIQKQHKKLEEEYQEDSLHFNLADINYRKKNYQEAQIHLIQVQFSDIFYNLGAKAMLLKIYYETNEGEALFALIASFSIYLRRNKKIAKDVREGYLNFATFLGKIVRSHKEKYPIIIEKINDTKRLYNRNWLLEICQTR